MTINFQPLNNLVLIDVEEKTEDKTKGGIIMTNVQKPDEGIAAAVGLGLKTPKGTPGLFCAKRMVSKVVSSVRSKSASSAFPSTL